MTILSLLEWAGPLSIMLMLVIMGLLSQRLGAVTRHPPIYRGLFLSAGFVGISLVCEIFFLVTTNTLFTLFYDVSLVIGLALGVVIVWRYWGWLLSENQTMDGGGLA